jgi:hypothetical protein
MRRRSKRSNEEEEKKNFVNSWPVVHTFHPELKKTFFPFLSFFVWFSTQLSPTIRFLLYISKTNLLIESLKGPLNHSLG